jgi:hypothetical protein
MGTSLPDAEVVEARSLGGHRVYLRFDDWVEGEVDLQLILEPFRDVLADLRDPGVFARTLYVPYPTRREGYQHKINWWATREIEDRTSSFGPTYTYGTNEGGSTRRGASGPRGTSPMRSRPSGGGSEPWPRLRVPRTCRTPTTGRSPRSTTSRTSPWCEARLGGR